MIRNFKSSAPFDSYEREPSPGVWQEIEKHLPVASDKKRGLLPRSVASILILAVLFSTYLFDVEIKPKHKEIVVKSYVAPKNEVKNRSEKFSVEKKSEVVIVKSSDDNNDYNKLSSENIQLTNSIQTHKGEKNVALSATDKINSLEENDTNENESTTVIAAITEERFTTEKIKIKNFTGIPIADIFPETLSVLVTDVHTKKTPFSLSRWEFSLLVAQNYNYRVLNFTASGNRTLDEQKKNYLSENETGIRTESFEVNAGYSLSTHFSLITGINYFIQGQERNQSEVTLTGGTADNSNRVYSINTSAGSFNTSGQQFDNAYYNNDDSTLFQPSSPLLGAPLPLPDEPLKSFRMIQQFSFISIPFLVRYQSIEHRFTPYFGLGFSAGYTINQKIMVNDKTLDYSYSRSINSIVFFAEAQAGIKYFVSNHFSFKIQPALRYGLNSVSNNNNVKWIPYSLGVGAGIIYKN